MSPDAAIDARNDNARNDNACAADARDDDAGSDDSNGDAGTTDGGGAGPRRATHCGDELDNRLVPWCPPVHSGGSMSRTGRRVPSGYPRRTVIWAGALAASLAHARAEAQVGVGDARGERTRSGFLEWEAPSGCPDAASAYHAMASAAGFPPEQGRFQHLRGVIARDADGWRLTLEFVEGGIRTTRRIVAGSCVELDRGAAVAVALALGDQRSLPRIEDPPPRVVGADEGPGTVQTQAAVASRSAPLKARLVVGGVFDLASIAGASWGLEVEGTAALHRLELGLHAIWLPATRRYVRSDEWVDFGLIAAGPRGCYRGLDGKLAAKLCGSFEVGRLQANGAGLSAEARRVGQWWLAPALGLELTAQLGTSWLLRIHADGLRPLVREQYTVNGSEVVLTPPELALRIGLGVGLTLP